MVVQIAQVFVGALRGVGFIGALAGGSLAAARVYARHQNGRRVRPVDAARVIGKEAAGTGVATAAGFAAVAIIGRSVFPPVATAMLAATGAKYLYDRMARRL